MCRSVAASVGGRHHHRHHLPLLPRQWAWSAHDLYVEIVVLSHDPGMHPMNLDDIVVIRHPIQLGNFRFWNLGYIGHAILPAAPSNGP